VTSLKERLASEIREAMRSRQKTRLMALRMLSTQVTNLEKEVLHELDDEEVRQVAAREVKRRTESIEAFESAGREDLASREREEREVLRTYAPEELSEAEVDALIEEAIAATGASSAKEMGKVMGLVMGKARGRADGNVVQQKVRARLGG
jgi:hypothetical protein